MVNDKGFWEQIKNEIALDNPWSLESYSDLIEELPVPISVVDVTGRYALVNSKFCDMTGYTRDELLQKTYWDITAKTQGGLNKTANIALQNFGVTGWFQKDYVRKDGLRVGAVIKVRRFSYSGRFFYLTIIDLP